MDGPAVMVDFQILRRPAIERAHHRLQAQDFLEYGDAPGLVGVEELPA